MAKKKTGSRWTEVTVFSKFLAIVLFILLPLLFFWFGMHMQKSIDEVRFSTPVIEQGNLMPQPTSSEQGF
jgi:hypothetical protein